MRRIIRRKTKTTVSSGLHRHADCAVKRTAPSRGLRRQTDCAVKRTAPSSGLHHQAGCTDKRTAPSRRTPSKKTPNKTVKSKTSSQKPSSNNRRPKHHQVKKNIDGRGLIRSGLGGAAHAVAPRGFYPRVVQATRRWLQGCTALAVGAREALVAGARCAGCRGTRR